MAFVLQPITPDPHPTWPAATWIGQLQERDLGAASFELARGEGFAHARILIRHGSALRGFVEVPVDHAQIDGAELSARLAQLPIPSQVHEDPPTPPMSLVICTRSHPDSLENVLRSAVLIDYPEFEILVVDNGPEDPRTAAVVEQVAREHSGTVLLRCISAPIAGLSRARNVALRNAAHDLLAFTDDDVIIDPLWLRGIALGLSRDPRVSCVTGIVPSIEINSMSQWYFDRRVNWARSCVPDLFSRADHRPQERLFPFQVGRFGTGANFAIRRSVAIALGGFDEGLGVGSPTGGGEDIDMFVRVILAGHSLAYEPSAIIWHRHRSDDAMLRTQMADYGTGLGAWLTKIALQPRVLPMLLRRAVPAAGHLSRLTKVRPEVPEIVDEDLLVDLGRLEWRSIVRGPLALLRSRRGGARSKPLVS